MSASAARHRDATDVTLISNVNGDRLVFAGEHVLAEGDIVGADFSGSRFSSFSARANFVDCTFASVTFLNADLAWGGHSTFTACLFDSSVLKDCDPGDSRFERCVFRDVDVSGVVNACSEYIRCMWYGTVADTRFCGSPVAPCSDRALRRRRNAFEGNDFSGADLQMVEFTRGIDLSQQRLPTGDEYLIVPSRVLSEVSRSLLREEHPRTELAAFLRYLAISYVEQPRVLLRLPDPGNPMSLRTQLTVRNALEPFREAP